MEALAYGLVVRSGVDWLLDGEIGHVHEIDHELV
jgi:hypothetical protein